MVPIQITADSSKKLLPNHLLKKELNLKGLCCHSHSLPRISRRRRGKRTLAPPSQMQQLCNRAKSNGPSQVGNWRDNFVLRRNLKHQQLSTRSGTFYLLFNHLRFTDLDRDTTRRVSTTPTTRDMFWKGVSLVQIKLTKKSSFYIETSHERLMESTSETASSMFLLIFGVLGFCEQPSIQ